MSMPRILSLLNDLISKVTTNTEKIEQNTTSINENKELFDEHAANDERHLTEEDRQNFNKNIHFKGYYETRESLEEAYPTGTLGDYAIVGNTDTVWLWDGDTNSWVNSMSQGTVVSVNGKTGEVIITKTDIGLNNVDNTSDMNKPISTQQQAEFNSKVDRKVVPLEQIDGLSLRSGIYYIQNEQKTIKDFTSSYWTVIVGENNYSTSVSQIWMNVPSDSEQHIYIRRQQNGTAWSDFTEIITTNIVTQEEISRFKQYKGFFSSISELNSSIPTAVNGDYAIVGNAIYVWNSDKNEWSEISGSGGSVGLGKWSVRQYNTPEITAQKIPEFKDILGKSLDVQWEVEDTADYLLNKNIDNYKIFLFETYVNIRVKKEISTTIVHDDGVNIFINGESIYSSEVNKSAYEGLTLNLVKGWNKIQILLVEVTGEEKFKLGIKITDDSDCLLMDCYHAETEPILAYVPLVGDSIIEGNITTTGNLQANGTLNVTSNMYLEYNEEDNSLSFMFNN